MKTMLKAAGLSLAILGTSFFANAAEAAQKVGYVNTAQIFQALPQREAVLQKLQAEFKDQNAELQALEAKIKTKVEQGRRDGELLGEDGVRKLQIEIGQLQAEYKIKAQSLEQTGQKREAQERQKLLKLIQDTVAKVAEKEGFDVVIDATSLQYAKPELNLSKKVIEQLK
ncbi:putative Outer membrane chaperone Skp (OmpH) [Vibrio nigripulchritudo MADA3029]|nr:chaperone protein skp [Vibrio nigripulchritudo ATCC 27043]KJY69025.1 molecular chaperone [Vibrio nigripulchritudo]CCN32839.1 putative Outer membrane chaperone Skp (OmpH) [Vibrio nigripulchritudo AM115]CCN40946.1 putative Outer membrane chaperone Skp (OmpH) [Vibrio nigripulchritudo FTn2]CCN48409.1 putative Outer membrane chaperone Skp (OmpH) [Vibrio nigripulchritudo MADA3020]CCN52180.1 putative Outer membrane chaperone Skp (OmpH) [Vibrio nigripulchritudo MADA3021]CCN58094.1 putative Outer m